ncbi:MAG: phosphoribosylformylglycinamidine cyclo-ligase, partial [Clostridia bacterium]|nr:phosphoribosylformylglycinamidine cyclo-ligase [Clostridia bacterium]
SSGIHSNGFSLVRKILDVENTDLNKYYDELGGTLGETLLAPTCLYVKPVLACMEKVTVKGVSHITGGGFYENIPRCLPEGFGAKITKSALRIPPIFTMLQRMGEVSEHDMFNTFNMGTGMIVIVDKNDADTAIATLKAEGVDAYAIGEIVRSDEQVTIC